MEYSDSESHENNLHRRIDSITADMILSLVKTYVLKEEILTPGRGNRNWRRHWAIFSQISHHHEIHFRDDSRLRNTLSLTRIVITFNINPCPFSSSQWFGCIPVRKQVMKRIFFFLCMNCWFYLHILLVDTVPGYIFLKLAHFVSCEHCSFVNN